MKQLAIAPGFTSPCDLERISSKKVPKGILQGQEPVNEDTIAFLIASMMQSVSAKSGLPGFGKLATRCANEIFDEDFSGPTQKISNVFGEYTIPLSHMAIIARNMRNLTNTSKVDSPLWGDLRFGRYANGEPVIHEDFHLKPYHERVALVMKAYRAAILQQTLIFISGEFHTPSEFLERAVRQGSAFSSADMNFLRGRIADLFDPQNEVDDNLEFAKAAGIDEYLSDVGYRGNMDADDIYAWYRKYLIVGIAPLNLWEPGQLVEVVAKALKARAATIRGTEELAYDAVEATIRSAATSTKDDWIVLAAVAVGTVALCILVPGAIAALGITAPAAVASALSFGYGTAVGTGVVVHGLARGKYVPVANRSFVVTSIDAAAAFLSAALITGGVSAGFAGVPTVIAADATAGAVAKALAGVVGLGLRFTPAIAKQAAQVAVGGAVGYGLGVSHQILDKTMLTGKFLADIVNGDDEPAQARSSDLMAQAQECSRNRITSGRATEVDAARNATALGLADVNEARARVTTTAVAKRAAVHSWDEIPIVGNLILATRDSLSAQLRALANQLAPEPMVQQDSEAPVGGAVAVLSHKRHSIAVRPKKGEKPVDAVQRVSAAHP